MRSASFPIILLPRCPLILADTRHTLQLPGTIISPVDLSQARQSGFGTPAWSTTGCLRPGLERPEDFVVADGRDSISRAASARADAGPLVDAGQ